MSMIRTVSYKASIQADGSIYNESTELSAEMDSMPLAQSQLDDAMARVDQLRQAILSRHKQREQGAAPAREAPKDQPKAAGQNTLDGSKPAAPAKEVRCIVCGTPVEHRENKEKGTEWSFCKTCKDNRRVDGTEFPPKKGA